MADFDAKSMIKRIERVIAEKGMSKEEFYSKSGVSSASFSQWNTGTHGPTSKKIFAIAQCLNVSVEFLTGEDTKEKSPAPLGAELTKESIQMLLDRMSAEDLSALIADAASELAKRNAKK